MNTSLDEFTDANNEAHASLLRLRALKAGLDIAGQRKRCRGPGIEFGRQIKRQADVAKERKRNVRK